MNVFPTETKPQHHGKKSQINKTRVCVWNLANNTTTTVMLTASFHYSLGKLVPGCQIIRLSWYQDVKSFRILLQQQMTELSAMTIITLEKFKLSVKSPSPSYQHPSPTTPTPITITITIIPTPITHHTNTHHHHHHTNTRISQPRCPSVV